MRVLLSTLLLVTAASVAAQPDRAIADLDRQIAALDREMARVEMNLATVRADLARIRAEERTLDAERDRFQREVRTYEADAEAVRREADRVQMMYDYLLRSDGGSRADRRAYDQARFRLEDQSERLRGQTRMIDDWADEIDAGYREHALSVRETAGLGQSLASERSNLYHRRETLVARRDRLAVRGTGRTHTHVRTHSHTVTHRH